MFKRGALALLLILENIILAAFKDDPALAILAGVKSDRIRGPAQPAGATAAGHPAARFPRASLSAPQ